MTSKADFSLRPATDADADFLYQLFLSSRERELGPLPETMRSQVGEFQYGLHKRGVADEYPDAKQLVILDAAIPRQASYKPVGMLMVAERPGVLWLIDIAIDPDNRNLGLGGSILRFFMEECRRTGRIMRGSVTPYNPARRLYARLGMREIGDGGRGYISLEWRPDQPGHD